MEENCSYRLSILHLYSVEKEWLSVGSPNNQRISWLETLALTIPRVFHTLLHSSTDKLLNQVALPTVDDESTLQMPIDRLRGTHILVLYSEEFGESNGLKLGTS